jgi:serine phosphatase RsbU (regulator of sigma subunit)
VLGRHPSCDVVLEVGAVSRQHARIVRIDDNYFVEDLGSRNGTFLNDQRVEGRQKLAENDQVKICDIVLVFHKQPPAPLAQVEDAGENGGTLVFDDDRTSLGSTITSKVDVSAGATSLRLSVNAEAKLKALVEISRNLGRAVSLNEVLPKLLDSLFAIFLQADRGFIVLKEAATGKLVPRAVRHRREDSTEPIRISRTILNGVVSGKEAILSADAATDARFEMAESIVDFQIHSMMCAPLITSEGKVVGVIQIDTRDQRHRFTREDLEVLASVACQAAFAVENAQLHEVALQEEVMRRELALAHKVQQGLLPAAPPELAGYEFFDFYEPANHLGGDYFDYIPLAGGRLAVTLADVSGKGISAALLMAKLSAEARYCLASEPTPAAAVARLNDVFCESRWEGRFVTFILTVLEPATHEVVVVNAGHLTPLLRHLSGSVEAVGEAISGLPLGVDTGVTYESFRFHLDPGDSVTLYTDGIPDAMNPAEEFYGGDRLYTQLSAPCDSVRLLGERVLEDVRRFIGSRSQLDDMCLSCFRRNE